MNARRGGGESGADVVRWAMVILFNLYLSGEDRIL